jgi:hypothetical protein
MGFRSLQHIRIRRSTHRGFAAPATFRPQGLVTLSAVCSLRARAGFLSRRRRSWDSPFGAFPSRKVSGVSPPGRTHVPFFLSLLPSPKRRAGSTGRGFWASTLAGVPGGQRMVNTPTAGCSLGFPLLGRADRSLERTFALSPLTRFADRPEERPSAPQSIDRPLPDPVHPTRKPRGADRTTLVGFLHRHNPDIQTTGHPGYPLTLCCALHCCRLASMLRMIQLALPELSGPA